MQRHHHHRAAALRREDGGGDGEVTPPSNGLAQKGFVDMTLYFSVVQFYIIYSTLARRNGFLRAGRGGGDLLTVSPLIELELRG